MCAWTRSAIYGELIHVEISQTHIEAIPPLAFNLETMVDEDIHIPTPQRS